MESNRSTYDVIVLGGGIVGSSTAEVLARRGQRTLLVDQFEPGHKRGSSHGDGRIIRLAYPEPIYIEMVQLAYTAWAELAERAGEPLLQTTGGLDCAPIGSPHLVALEKNFKHFNIAYERLTAQDANQRFPQFHLDENTEAIYQADAGVIFAGRAVTTLWRLAEAAGALTQTGQRIKQITVQNGSVKLQSQSGHTWQAGRLVIAAGSWARQLLLPLGLDLPLEATQEQIAYFPVKGAVSHRAGIMPNFIDHHTPAHPFYALPQIEVPGVKVGCHNTGQKINPDQPQPLDPANLAAVKNYVRTHFPHLDPSPFDVQSCLYTNTPDYHFILDRHPELPNVVIAAGFSGHGFKFGPILGQIMAALALDEKPPLSLTQFALSRFSTPEKLHQRANV